ncbi:MAG: cupin domain-containing protein [Pseudomonadota bacterium]
MSTNLFDDLPQGAEEAERFDLLLRQPGVHIERIVSTGQASPPGFWHDQEQGEWVVLLTGTATLRFENEAAPVDMRPGDWLHIAPHRRHRVERTAAGEATVWLAVHFDPG